MKAAAAREDPFSEIPDILHVGHKFPKLRNVPWLEHRLGRAITRRRQFLRYCKMHKDKLAEGTLQEVWKPSALEVEVQKPQLSPVLLPNENEPEQKPGLRVPSVLASTKASTLAVPSIGVLPESSDDVDTSTVVSSSLGDELETDGLQVPLIPDDAAAGMEFECPFCWTIQAFRRKASRSWK